MRKTSIKIYGVIFASLLLASVGITAVSALSADAWIYVYNPADGVWGKWFGSYYAGAVPIDIRASSIGNKPGGETTRAYCIKYDGPIYVGREYPVNLTAVVDTVQWREIAYVLTWYDYPSGPANSSLGVWIQGAIWQLLDGSTAWKSWVPSSYWAGIQKLVDEATTPPKDVIRPGDKFEWISPMPGNNTNIVANPGETITLAAKITHKVGADWVGRSGVKVEFKTNTGLYAVGWTGNDGIVQVEVAVPDCAGTIEVKAYTRGVWPQKFIDLNGDSQDLLGIGTSYVLTVTTNVWILAYIHVVPEIPLGTLAVVVTCFSAIKIRARRAKR